MSAQPGLDGALQWAAMLQNPGRFGFRKEFQKVVTRIKRVSKEAFKQHRAPTGTPWEPTAPRYAGNKKGRKRKGKRRRLPALYRRDLKNRLYEKITGGRGKKGHIEKVWGTGFEVGGWGRGLVKHQEGEGNLPERPMLEWTEEIFDYAEEVFAEGVMKRLGKGAF